MKSFLSIKTIVVFSFLLLSACGKSEDPAETGALAEDSGVLKYIPAGSNYVFARVGQMPDAYLQTAKPKIDAVMEKNRELMQSIVDESLQNANNKEAEKIAALVKRLSEYSSPDGLRALGITDDSQAAIYGHTLIPVLRAEASDSAAVEEALSQMEAEAGVVLQKATLGDATYRYFEEDKLQVLILVHDGQFVMTMAPVGLSEASLKQLLGLELPEQNIADAGTLAGVAGRHGFLDSHIGFVDMEAIVTQMTGDAGDLTTELMAIVNPDGQKPLSDVCRDEIRGMAEVAPRMAFGYTSVTSESMDGSMVVELREDIAKGLSGLSNAVPGLGAIQQGLASFGFSFDVKVARAFVESRIEALEENPLQCEFFAEMQASVDQAREYMSQPTPPTAYDFRGTLFVLDSIDGISGGPANMDGQARALLAIDNAESLMALGNLFVPELAALEIKPDGEIHELESAWLSQAGGMAYIAMSDDAIGVSVGDNGEERLAELMNMPVNKEAPLFNVEMDATRYFELVGDASMVTDGSEPAAVQEASREILSAMGDIYDRMSFDIDTSEHGIEFRTKLLLK